MIELKAKVRSGEPAVPVKVAKSKPGASKIEEVDKSSKQEELEVSKLEDKPAEVKKVKTKNLDKDTVDKAAEIASKEANEAALKSIPKTSAGFEKDFNQLKKDTSNVYQYLRAIPAKTFETLYKSSEIEAHVFSGLLTAITEHGLSSKDGAKHAGEFLASMSKASSFDMTLMFLEDQEKKAIKSILTLAKKQSDKATAKILDDVYGNL